MSNFEIIYRLCDAVSILAQIVTKQQSLLDQQDAAQFEQEYENVKDSLNGICTIE